MNVGWQDNVCDIRKIFPGLLRECTRCFYSSWPFIFHLYLFSYFILLYFQGCWGSVQDAWFRWWRQSGGDLHKDGQVTKTPISTTTTSIGHNDINKIPTIDHKNSMKNSEQLEPLSDSLIHTITYCLKLLIGDPTIQLLLCLNLFFCRDSDGAVTEEEFMEACSSDKDMMKLLTPNVSTT